MVGTLKDVLLRLLKELTSMDPEERLARRYAKLRALGNGLEGLDAHPAPAHQPVAKA